MRSCFGQSWRVKTGFLRFVGGGVGHVQLSFLRNWIGAKHPVLGEFPDALLLPNSSDAANVEGPSPEAAHCRFLVPGPFGQIACVRSDNRLEPDETAHSAFQAPLHRKGPFHESITKGRNFVARPCAGALALHFRSSNGRVICHPAVLPAFPGSGRGQKKSSSQTGSRAISCEATSRMLADVPG